MMNLLQKEVLSGVLSRINLSRWMRALIIIGVIFASFFLVVYTSQRLTFLLLGFLLGLGGTMIIMRWPPLGFILIVFGGMFVRFSGPGGFNAAILGVGFVLGLWFLEMIVRERKIHFVPSPTNVPLFAFIISSLISFGFGQFLWYPLAGKAPLDAQLGGLTISLLSAGAFLVAANQIKTLRWLKAFTWIFVVLGAIYILGRLIPGLRWIPSSLFQRGARAGSVFWVWLVVIPLSQAMFNQKLNWKWKASLITLVLATLYVAAIMTSGWKSGYIPPMAGAAVIVGIRLKRRVLFFLPIAIILAILFLNQAIAADQYSYSTRLEAWQIVLEIAKVNPITGLGYANYYWYTPLFPIRGYSVVFNSHSQYADLIAQTGLVGLFCFLWIFWSLGKLGWSLLNRVPEGFAKAYVVGALGGISGMLVAGAFVDWVLPFVYNIGMDGFRSSILGWIFLGGLVSVEQVINQRPLDEG